MFAQMLGPRGGGCRGTGGGGGRLSRVGVGVS
jgi:hypothetical protein